MLIDVKHVDNPAIVTVFGAGIAGLTVAHELVTRGCLVQVVESRPDAYARGRPLVGGMAATQYARVRANIEDLHPELVEPEEGEGRRSKQAQKEEASARKVRRWLVRLFAQNRSWWIQTEEPIRIHEAIFKYPDEFGPIILPTLQQARRKYRRRWIWDLIVRNAIIGNIQHASGQDATAAMVELYRDVIGRAPRGADEKKLEKDDPNALALRILLLLRAPEGKEDPVESDFTSNQPAIRQAFEREFLCFRLIPHARSGTVDGLAKARDLLAHWEAFFEQNGLADNLLTQEPHFDVSDRGRDADVRMVDTASWGPACPNAWLELEIVEQRLPGEHGFRFFPSYYRHIDDTMQRIPLGVEPYSGTAYDNFRATTHQRIGLSADDRKMIVGLSAEAQRETKPVDMMRSRPKSIEAWRDSTHRFWARLGCDDGDAAYSSGRLLRFMTSGPERRRQYEDVSWRQFIGLEPCRSAGPEPVLELDKLAYSQAMTDQLEKAAQCVLALSAGEADARTYGAATIQLFIDLLGDGTRTDRTLNGPTSDAWLEPWREHLERLGVRFFLGKLDGLKSKGGEVVPVFADWGKMRKHSQDAHNLLTHEDAKQGWQPDFYVLALDLPAASTLIDDAIADRKAAPDFAQMKEFHAVVQKTGLKDMTGVQFFFDAKASIGKGHTYYPYSEWGLSSISQSEFWSERGGFADGYLGVFSVDVSATNELAHVRTGGKTIKSKMGGGQALPDGVAKLCFRDAQCSQVDEHEQQITTPEESDKLQLPHGNLLVARAVWDQLRYRIGDADELPEPRAFHVDQNVERKGGKLMNGMPFLAALPRTWQLRPGITRADAVDKTSRAKGAKEGDIHYAVNHGRWVLCGTYMATHTRMTSMEAANESGRHAAIAILNRLQTDDHAVDYQGTQGGELFKIRTLENKKYNHAFERRVFDRPDIVKMEDHELDDLKFMRELDSKLFAAELPHWMDICDFDKRLELAAKAAKLDRDAGIKHGDLAEQLVSSTVKSLEAVLGHKLLTDDHRKAVDGITELVKKFLH